MMNDAGSEMQPCPMFIPQNWLPRSALSSMRIVDPAHASGRRSASLTYEGGSWLFCAVADLDWLTVSGGGRFVQTIIHRLTCQLAFAQSHTPPYRLLL